MTYKSAERPLCHYCGKPIAKHTESHYVRDPDHRILLGKIEGPLRSKAECQARTNQIVTSVSYHETRDYDGEPTGPRSVWKFNTWDGESYVDEFFCNGTCASEFAYLMARSGRCTNRYNVAVARRDEEAA